MWAGWSVSAQHAPAAADTLSVPWWAWAATLGALAVLLVLDLLVGRSPHRVGNGEAGLWVGVSVACAVIFGLGVWWFGDAQSSVEYFTGYLTEYSLSVDNLFVFMAIISSFAVPAIYQQRVLVIGILLALALRGAFIAAGAAMISHFSWVFVLFGAMLMWAAVGMLRGPGGHTQYHETSVVRWVRRVLPVTREYHGTRQVVRLDGKWWLTPMFVVIVAIGSVDVLFAADSIPAIFGITQDAFLVFAANAFALMGLRQLFFLLGGLIDKLVYLSRGLAVILAFIGVKLVLHALTDYDLVPDWLAIGNWTSLGVIVAVLLVTALASLWRSRRVAAQHPTRRT